MSRNCAKRRFGMLLARRNVPSKRRVSWCLRVSIFRGHQIGRQSDFSTDILFGAAHGGSAKSKAAPKLQSLVARINECLDCDEKLRVNAILGRVSKKGDEDAPAYELRYERTFYEGIVTEHRPSKFFKVVQNGHNGGNGHRRKNDHRGGNGQRRDSTIVAGEWSSI